MRILWTQSKNPVDWIIKLFTGEDCGHMALLFEAEHGTGIVFESNLLGCHPAFYSTWMGKTRTLIHEHVVNLTPAQEDQLWTEWVTHFDGKSYDLAGAFYLGLCKLRKRLLGTPLPSRNRWASKDKFFCDEVFQIFKDVDGLPTLPMRANAMSTPHDVWLAIQAVGK